MRKMTMMIVAVMAIGTLAPDANADGLEKIRKAVARAVRHSVRDARRQHDRQRVRHHASRPQWAPPVRYRAPRRVPPRRTQPWTPPLQRGGTGYGTGYGGTCYGTGYGTGSVSRWIGRHRDPYRGHGLDYWIDRMFSHHDEDDREDAAERLGKIGDPRAIPYLEQAAAFDHEDDVRDEAHKAIRRILRHRGH